MNKTIACIAGMFLLTIAPVAFATTASFGSLGQPAGTPSVFDVPLCNAPTVTVSVVANGKTLQVAVPASSGGCASVSASYASFGMTAGVPYTVSLAAPGVPPASYSLVVPPAGMVLGADAVAPDQNTIDLMASEVNLVQQLISLIQGALGR